MATEKRITVDERMVAEERITVDERMVAEKKWLRRKE